MNINEIKLEIKRLKKLKKELRAGTKARIVIYRQIKDLEKKLIDYNKPNDEKDKLIEEIKAIDNTFERLDIDLKKYTIEQLQFHLKRIKNEK